MNEYGFASRLEEKSTAEIKVIRNTNQLGLVRRTLVLLHVSGAAIAVVVPASVARAADQHWRRREFGQQPVV
jgi:hypothetical protein